MRSVQIKCHDIDTSLLEGVLSRGDRRHGPGRRDGLAARRTARGLVRVLRYRTLVGGPGGLGHDAAETAHCDYPLDARLPWDHIQVNKGRPYLAKEHGRAMVQLNAMTESIVDAEGG